MTLILPLSIGVALCVVFLIHRIIRAIVLCLQSNDKLEEKSELIQDIDEDNYNDDNDTDDDFSIDNSSVPLLTPSTEKYK